MLSRTSYWHRFFFGSQCHVAEEPAAPQTDPWVDLEDGIQIQFLAALSALVPNNPNSVNFVSPVNNYRTGDYWLIPARTAIQGSLEWPATSDNPRVPIALPPHGVDHHYLPLGIVGPGATGSISTVFVSPINKIV